MSNPTACYRWLDCHCMSGPCPDLAHAAPRAEAIDSAISEAFMVRPEITDTLAEIRAEVLHAEANWPAMNSAHEAFAVLAEEVDELWAHVKVNQRRRDLEAMRKEAIQVAAMAVRFARDVCSEDRGRR